MRRSHRDHPRQPGRQSRRRAADHADLRDDDVRLRQRRRGAWPTTKGGRRSSSTRATRTRPSSRSRRSSPRSKAPRRRCCSRAGMAATSTALLALLKAGDEMVCSAAIYGGTLHLLADLLRALRHHGRGSSSLDELRAAGARHRRSRRRWSGSSRRSTRRCAASTSRRSPPRAAPRRASRSSTTRSPARSTSSRWRSASTSSMQSATKYLNGHSDVTGGVAGRAGARSMAPIEKARRHARHGHGSACRRMRSAAA